MVLKLIKQLINLIQIFRPFDSVMFFFTCLRQPWWAILLFSRFFGSCWRLSCTLGISSPINWSWCVIRTRKFEFYTCCIHVFIHLITDSRWIVIRSRISLHKSIWKFEGIGIRKTSRIRFAGLGKVCINRNVFKCYLLSLMLKLHLLSFIFWPRHLRTIKDLIRWF